jgi:hypothetical protein
LGGMNALLFSSLHDASSLSCLSAVGCACLLGAAVKGGERYLPSRFLQGAC